MRKHVQKIILIGFMGSGKTTCAKQLAKELGWRDLDSDAIIERREKKTIPQIFDKKGESYFRTVESKVIKDLLLKPQTVLSFGGGAVCRKVNRALIKKKGFVVWLKSNSSTILKRTAKSKNRPLLDVKNRKKAVLELLQERQAYYKQCAHVVVPNNTGDCLTKLKRIPQIKAILKDKQSA